MHTPTKSQNCASVLFKRRLPDSTAMGAVMYKKYVCHTYRRFFLCRYHTYMMNRGPHHHHHRRYLVICKRNPPNLTDLI